MFLEIVYHSLLKLEVKSIFEGDTKGKGVDKDIELNDVSNSNQSDSDDSSDDDLTPKTSPNLPSLNLEKDVFNKPKTKVISKAYPGNTPEEKELNELFNVENYE